MFFIRCLKVFSNAQQNIFCCNFCCNFHVLLFNFLQHTTNGHVRGEVTSRSVRSSGRNRNSGSGLDDVHPVIGNYRLLKTIGKGNFAKVKLARHILTGSEVRSPKSYVCI